MCKSRKDDSGLSGPVWNTVLAKEMQQGKMHSFVSGGGQISELGLTPPLSS